MKDEYECLRLENQLCFPLYAAARKITSLYTPYLKPLGLTYTQYIVFMVLWETDGIPVTELCKKLFLDSGTITPLLKTLEKNGYVQRKRGTQDERVVNVYLTKEGKALRDKAKNVPACVGNCVHLSKEDAGDLYRILYEILNKPE